MVDDLDARSHFELRPNQGRLRRQHRQSVEQMTTDGAKWVIAWRDAR